MHKLKNLDRLKTQNVRSSVARKPIAEISLERLRQVTGGCSYKHEIYDDTGIVAEWGTGSL